MLFMSLETWGTILSVSVSHCLVFHILVKHSGITSMLYSFATEQRNA